jgi:hypothetical protein
MHSICRTQWALAFLVTAMVLVGGNCDTGQTYLAVRLDAEYNPDLPSDASASVHEAALSVAQTYTVLSDGEFSEFDFVITQGAAGSEGMVRVDVRPVLATGEPEPDDMNSIIDPIDVDTLDLPPTLVDEFTTFDLARDSDRQVLAGEQYAIVVTFLSRTAGNVNDPIALVLGRAGDEYLDGSGSLDPDGMGFTNNLVDYFFRTYVLR